RRAVNPFAFTHTQGQLSAKPVDPLAHSDYEKSQDWIWNPYKPLDHPTWQRGHGRGPSSSEARLLRFARMVEDSASESSSVSLLRPDFADSQAPCKPQASLC